MIEEWANISDDGELLVDWETVNEEALAFDAGYRNPEAAIGKIMVLIQREAFEQGYRRAVEDKVSSMRDSLITLTVGNA
jgi:hypothetical protein